jgi:hypothetical protein
VRRTIMLALVAALALALGAGSATAAVDGGAQTAAKKKAGKKKAAKCKAAKKKAKGKAKARKSHAVADSAAKKKAGKKKGKAKCAKPKAKAKPKSSPRKRVRNPYEQRIVDRYRERREQMEERRRNAPKPLTLPDVVPADGTYTSASAPGLTVTISANSTQARVQFVVPKEAFDAGVCRDGTQGEAVDITGPISISQSTKRGHLMLHASQPVDPSKGAYRSQDVTGSIGKDGSFDLSIGASFPAPTDLNATCSAFPPPRATGTLVK